MNLFQQALAFTLSWEGGLSDDPKDKGGRTNHGITQKTYDAWRTQCGEFTQDVAKITTEEVEAIYEERYWKYNLCVLMPYPLCIAVFDFAVNSGKHAGVTLQRMINTPLKEIDGIIGPKTISRLREFISGEGEAERFTERYIRNRMAFYRSLQNARFEHGWLNRCEALAKYLNLNVTQITL